MEERILTRHPDPEKVEGNITRMKYDVIRGSILGELSQHESLTFRQPVESAHDQLARQFVGSISWHVITVQLDLEACGEIERIEGSSPQPLRLVKSDD